MDGPPDIRTRLDQFRHDGRIASAAGFQQRGDAVAVGRNKVGTGPDERAHHRQVGVVHRPKQRRGAVARGLVDVGMFSDQRAHRLEITVFRRDDDCGITRRLAEDRREYRHERQQRDQQPSSRLS